LSNENDVSIEAQGSCGAESFWALAQRCGVKIEKEQAVLQLGKVGDESSLLKIKQEASSLGLTLDGQRLSYPQLCQHRLPVIAHWIWGHFIVVTHADENEVAIIDGYDREIVMSAGVFCNQWSGYILAPRTRSWRKLSGLVLVLGGAGLLAAEIFRLRKRRTTKGPDADTEA